MPKNFTNEYVTINGISQYFLHIPSPHKDVIIMLHGGPGLPNSHTAYYLQPYLDFCNVIYYDQRGAGKTQIKNKTKPESLSLDILLEDLRQTIQYAKEKYQTDRIILAGHSWGTVLGTQYIIKYPHDVIGYIGYGQIVDTLNSDRYWYEYLKSAVLKSGKKSDIKKMNAVNNNFPQIMPDEFVKATAVLEKLQYKYGYMAVDYMPIYRKSPIMTLKDVFQTFRAYRINEKLNKDVCFNYDIRTIKEYKTPIYYVLGRHDEWTSSVLAAEYFDEIHAPQKKLYWIENAGHMTDTDSPIDFCKTVKEIAAQW
jgi:pimeloyl-ACP methyl ester carboxylesterase